MRYKVLLGLKVLEDIERHTKSGNKKLLKKLDALLEELQEHPATGTGKPEVLKYYEQPVWSRRISGKHRLVYRIDDIVVTVLVLAAWGHYTDK